MTNNNQVNWDEIPEDVEAVVTFNNDVPSYYKTVNNKLMVQCYREDTFDNSGHGSVESAIEYFEDRWHSRPSPITQPTPEPPESTQVESSEVEDATTPEFDWSSVEDDVEAVIFNLSGDVVQHLKTIDDSLYFKVLGFMDHYIPSGKYKSLSDREENINDFSGGATLLRRPPATTPTDGDLFKKFEDDVGVDPEVYTPKSLSETDTYDIFKSADSKLSIYTILQEAQQSILKHHGATGKVKFTVTCSE